MFTLEYIKRLLARGFVLSLAMLAMAAILCSATNVTVTNKAQTRWAEVDSTAKALRVIQYDSRGNVVQHKATYTASTTAKTAVAAGTAPFAQIFGSATKTIRVQRIVVTSTTGTAATYTDIVVTKRTAAGSGGTATTLTQVPHDSTSAAGTATVVKLFTAAPTAGTGGGVIASRMVFAPITGTPATIVQPAIFDWSNAEAEAPVLRGTGEGLEISTGTTTTNAPTVTVEITWTEE